MKIMKVVDKKVGNITYHKYRINLPKEAVEKTDLLGKDLEVIIEGKNLTIKKRKV
jgi:hypothetical protein